ncbi:serine-rich adhesin for platelets, partial [Biomphalaria glabrata]
DTAEAQTPEEKVQPDKTIISPPRDSHRRRTGKNKKKQRKNKGAVTEDHDKKLKVTVQSVVKGAKLEIDLDKKDISNSKQEEFNNYKFQYSDCESQYPDFRSYLDYLSESDDGFTKVVRKHRPRRNVSSLDKTASNNDKTPSSGSESRKKESTRARRKPSATNTDIKEKAAESSLSKIPQNKGKSSTATTGNRKKEPTSTKASPRNSKRSRAPRAARSKNQSHTPSTRKTNLSTSRPASKHPSAEKHQLSDRSNSSNSVSSSTFSNTSSTVSSVSKVYSQGISRSYSSIVASKKVSSTASSSGKIASVPGSNQVKNSTLRSSLQSSQGVRKLANQSQPEKNQEMSGRSSDVRVTSEDNDVGLISQESSDMSFYSQAIPSVKKKYSKSKATLVKSLTFESSILGVNKQSTCSPLEKDQDLVFSSSDDLSDVGWTSPEALGSMDSLRPQSTSSDQYLHNLSLQDPLIISANNPLVGSLPGVMNADINFTWNFLENQTQVLWQNRGVDGQTTHPELEKKQVSSSSDERVTSEDSDPFYMSPSSLLSRSLLDEMTSTEINADIDDTPRIFEHPLYPHVFCRTPGKKKNPWMIDNSPEKKGISNPFHVPTVDSPFYNSDRLRKTTMNTNTLAGSVGQADSCFYPSIVFESLQLELGDEKDLRQAVEKKVLTSLKVERATWLEKLKKVALKNIENLEELVKSAEQEDDRCRYSQVKQKIRDWTLHLELCDQGLMEVTQGELQILTMDKIMDSLWVSSTPICLTIEEPISPELLKRYEGVIEVIQQSFPGYSWSSIFTKLEALRGKSGGTLNNFSTYHLNKAIKSAIIQEKLEQANLATSPLASHKSVCHTNSGQKYSHSTASQRSGCSTAGRRSSRRTSQNNEQQPSRSRKGGQRRSHKRFGCGRLDGR